MFSRFTDTEAKRVRALLKSPTGEAALAEIDAARVAKRSALKARRAAILERMAKGLPSVEKQCSRAVADADAARRALAAAEAALTAVRAQAGALRCDGEVGDIERELRDDADARILEFRGHLGAIDGRCNAATRAWFERKRDNLGSAWTVTHTNAKEVTAARAALAECIARTHDLELDALSATEIAAALVALCRHVESPLAALELNPPQLDRSGNVGAPIKFQNKSVWLVDEINVAPREAPRVEQPVEGPTRAKAVRTIAVGDVGAQQ